MTSFQRGEEKIDSSGDFVISCLQLGLLQVINEGQGFKAGSGVARLPFSRDLLIIVLLLPNHSLASYNFDWRTKEYHTKKRVVSRETKFRLFPFFDPTKSLILVAGVDSELDQSKCFIEGWQGFPSESLLWRFGKMKKKHCNWKETAGSVEGGERLAGPWQTLDYWCLSPALSSLPHYLKIIGWAEK